MLSKKPWFQDIDDLFSNKWVSFATADTAFPMDIIKAYEYKRVIPNIAEYNVVANKIKSVYKDGILSITLPKAEEEKPTTIEVKVE